MANMKRNAFIVLLLCMAEALFAQQEIIMPPFLKAGDTIVVISPSSTPDSLTVVTRCLSLCALCLAGVPRMRKLAPAASRDSRE